MFGFEHILRELTQQQAREAERQYDATYLKWWLKHVPPSEHARIRAEHAAGIAKREADRTAERRHRELCQAIRNAGRSASRLGWWP